MKNIMVKYNPYKVETEIIVDNDYPGRNSILKKCLKNRLQLWIDEFPKMLNDEYNDEIYNIKFHGTDPDYQDLSAAIENAKSDEELSDCQFNLEKIPAKEFGDKEKDLKVLIEKAKKLPFKEFRAEKVNDAIEKAFSDELDVNVVATMSAGKSTLINALLGKKLMPSRSGACTATITRIRDDDSNTFKAAAFDVNNKELIYYPQLDYKTMKGLNQNKDVSEIHVSGNIPFVSSEAVSLILVDTPGPDNARDEKHSQITANALEKSSKMLVLFIMNGSTLHNTEQDNFLKRVADSMKVGGKQSKERFIFVINKMDTYDEEDDDIKNETLPDTIEYLEEMGITDPNVFPAASEPALLIRRYNNSIDETEKEQLRLKIEPIAEKLIRQKQLHLEKYPKLPHSCQSKIDSELNEAIKNNDIFAQALIHSGIRGIEETIKMYVTKYCRPVKISNVVNAFNRAFEEAEALSKAEEKITSETDKLAGVNKEINELERKLKSEEANKEFKNRIARLNITTDLSDKLDSLIHPIDKKFINFFASCELDMEEDTAMRYVNNFSKLVSDIQNDFYASVNRFLTDDIKNKADFLLNEYIRRLETISEEFNKKYPDKKINLPDFVKSELLSSVDVDNIIDESLDSRTEEHTEMRKTMVTKKRTGWDRFFHITEWFNPYYSVMEDVPVKVVNEVTYVSREKLNNILVSPVQSKLYGEKVRIIKFAEEETDNIKKFFYKRFDAVDAILSEIMAEFKKKTSSKEAAEAALNEARKLKNELNKIHDELEKILEI